MRIDQYHNPEVITRIAKEWVRGREECLLRLRVRDALANFKESDDYDPELESDIEAYAEELQMYAADTLESLPLGLIAFLIEEFEEE